MLLAIAHNTIAAPSDAPRNFRVESINKTTIEVYWRLPPLHTHGDVILGYKLFVQPVNGKETVVNIQDNDTNVYTQRVYTVGGLEPATLYSFSILIYNSLGDGPRTTNLTISTMSKQAFLHTPDMHSYIMLLHGPHIYKHSYIQLLVVI